MLEGNMLIYITIHLISKTAFCSTLFKYTLPYKCYIQTYTHTHIHTYTHTHIHTYTHTHMHTCTHTHIHTYIHTHIHTLTHTHIHTYTHTHMGTYIDKRPPTHLHLLKAYKVVLLIFNRVCRVINTMYFL